LKEIENPMVIDSLWSEREKEPEAIAECAGCGKDIYRGDDVYEFEDYGEIALIHQKADCCQHYVSEMSFCKVAGEN
jgi:hypothetical protein